MSVKGGQHVSVAIIRDLAHVVDREKAKLGVFIALAKPTVAMRTEAVKAGFYESPYHGKIPKIQILTIDELLSGKKPHIPFVNMAMFPRTLREESKVEQGALL